MINLAKEPWSLERIRVGNGEAIGRSKLMAGVLYGSDKRCGGPSTFFEIDRGSLQLFETTLPRMLGLLPLYSKYGSECGPVDEDECVIEDTAHIEEHRIHKSLDVAGLVEQYLDNHPGVILDTFGPGAREQNKALRKFTVRSLGKVRVQSNDGMCAVSALLNAIKVLNGDDKMKTVQKAWQELKPKLNGLADLTHLVQGMKTILPDGEAPEIQLQRVSKADWKIFQMDKFDWLVKTGGIWIVRLEQKDVVDHVVVDGRNRVVWDSVEEWQLDLNEHVLKGCGGKNARKLEILDVRLVVLQRQKRKIIEVIELD